MAAAQLLGADNLPSGTLTLGNEKEVVRKAGRQAISAFLDGHNCFSVLRASGKVVVFDTRIPIQLAFYALVEHGMFVLLAYCVFVRGMFLSTIYNEYFSIQPTLTALIVICLSAFDLVRYAGRSIMGCVPLPVCRVTQSHRLH